jgi:phosphate/sulfate permease
LLAGDGLLGWHGRILASRPRYCQTRAGAFPGRILAAHAAIGLGTMAGGWRIVKTMGIRRRGVAGRIVWAWVLTIPLSAVLAAATWLVLPHG